MHAKEKFKALEALKLTADPTNKPVIEENQKTLKQLENLDLRFEKHHGPLRNAPRAFKAFQSFMMEFVAKKTVPTLTESNDKGLAMEYVIIAISILVLALVIGVIGALYFWKKRKESKTEKK